MMNEITFCDLREKEVINTVDGKKLGRVVDLVMKCSGEVLGFVVPGERKLLRALSSCDTLFVPWKCIVKIGEDAILVKLSGNATESVCDCTEKKDHHGHHCHNDRYQCGNPHDRCGHNDRYDSSNCDCGQENNHSCCEREDNHGINGQNCAHGGKNYDNNCGFYNSTNN